MIRIAGVVAILAGLLISNTVPWLIALLISFAIYLIPGRWERVKILVKTFKRDLEFARIVFNGLIKTIMLSVKKLTLSDIVYQSLRRYPNKPAFIDADTKQFLTFKEVEEMSHKIANIFHEAGYKNGDCVALIMENQVEYFPVLFGLSMIGVTTSLINYNLKGESLRHCIEVCNATAVIFSKDTYSAIEEIQNELGADLYAFDACEDLKLGSRDLRKLMVSASNSPPPKSSPPKSTDTLLYMYTSGTTGLPKAVLWSRKKFASTSIDAASIFSSEDILYESLPLYHGNGLTMAAICFFQSGTTVIKKKFSASQYIEDCCRYKVTVINYIGEVCRYILNQPESVFDHIVSVRVAIGNGLRASIWEEFQKRFNIKSIIEFYGATEGNFVLFNAEGRVGAIGYQSMWFPFLSSKVKLIKVDEETNEILRDPNGLAIEADVGEPGQPVGRITRLTKFEGYTDEGATKKKIAQDIFSKGDSAFLSGDILIKDAEGYFYFQDRLGDTFRWKGENVSTNEVEGIISKVLQLTDVCVYGVEVPGNEGKAGMAFIMDQEGTINVENLAKAFDGILPKYSQPQFLRLSANGMELTGTFKFQKSKLRKEGYDPRLFGDDRVYFFDKTQKTYELISADVHERILSKLITF